MLLWCLMGYRPISCLQLRSEQGCASWDRQWGSRFDACRANKSFAFVLQCEHDVVRVSYGVLLGSVP